MKFSNVLAFVSMALAAPALQSRQQNTVVGTIQSSIQTLEDTTASNFNAINGAIKSVKDNVAVGLEAQIKATLKTNLEAIAVSLQNATTAITGVTTGAVGGIAEQVKGLGETQINNLAGAIVAANKILGRLQVTLTASATDLTPDIKVAIQSEIDAVKAVIAPFVTPLSIFAKAAAQASASVGVAVGGLVFARQELGGILLSFSSTLGVPGLDALITEFLLGGK